MVKEEDGTMNLVRRMRFVALLALMAIGLVATATAPVGATTIYADDQGRFAIGVPSGWVQQEPDSNKVVALWTTDGGAAIFNIVHASVAYGTSSVDFAKAASSSLSDYTDYYLIRKDFITCADQDCPLIDFTATDDNGETQRIHQIYVTKGGDGWILTYRTRASDVEYYNSDVELMVYSFTI
jgi:hypothetical protein